MTDQLMSNSLPVKADEIRAIVAESDAAALTGIQKALQAGHLLVAAKAECRHGEWLPFLERAGVPERKAQRYMKLAESGMKSDTVSDLGGIKAALEFVAKRKLPEPGTALIVFGDETRDFFNAAYVWGSTEYPSNYYVAAYSGLNATVTPRPIDGKPIEFPDEAPIHLVWEWLERHFDPPQADWIFETGSDAVAEIVFQALHLEEFEAEQKAAFNLANVHGLRLLIAQCEAVQTRAA